MVLNMTFNKKKDRQFEEDSKKLVDNLLTKAFETKIETPSNWLPTDFVKEELTSEHKIIFKTKNEAYQFLNSKVDKVVDKFIDRVSEFNSNDLLQFILHIENTLSKLTRERVNGKFSWEYKHKKDFPRFTEHVLKLNTDNPSVKEVTEIQIFFHNYVNFLGKIKKSIDVITNVLLINLKDSSNNDKSVDIQSMTNLISDSYSLWQLFHLFRLISKEKTETFNEDTIFIENGETVYKSSKNYYIESALNNLLQDYESSLDEKTETDLQELYYSELGFNIDSIVRGFTRPEFRYPCIFSKEELRNIFRQHSLSEEGLGLKGLLNLLKTDILLDYNQEDRKKFIFSDEKKLSIKGIVKIGDQYIFSIGTIYHYCLKLESKMRNPSFVNSPKINSFIQNHVSEFQLNKISKFLSENNVWNKIDVDGFDDLLSEESKKQNTTKQIDLLLYNDSCDEIFFVEYKNFLKKSFDKYREIQEEFKIKSFDKTHIKLLNDLKSKQAEFLDRYSIPASNDSQFVLVDVFEDRNILCGTNKIVDGYKVIYMSRVEFEEYLSSSLCQFAKSN
jgi:hypothetical protein